MENTIVYYQQCYFCSNSKICKDKEEVQKYIHKLMDFEKDNPISRSGRTKFMCNQFILDKKAYFNSYGGDNNG